MSKFLKFIVHLVILLAIVDVLALAVPPFLGINTAIIDGTKKESNMPLGSVTYAKPVSVNELREGDSVLVQEGSSVYRYKINSIDGSSGVFNVYDQTDVEAGEKSITLRNTAPKVIITIGYIGYLIIATQSTEGLIIIGLVILFLIILFILAELWRKDKRGYDVGEFEDGARVAAAEAAASQDAEQVLTKRQLKKQMKRDMKRQAKAEGRKVDKAQMKQEMKEASRRLKEEAKERKKEEKRRKKAAKKRARTGGFIEDYDPIETKITANDTKSTAASVSHPTRKQTQIPEKAQPAAVEPIQAPELSVEDKVEAALRAEVGEMLERTVEEPSPAEEVFVEPEPAEIKKMAIPVYTEEELLAKAQAAGETPNVIRDEKSGVTLLDYSDIILEEE